MPDGAYLGDTVVFELVVKDFQPKAKHIRVVTADELARGQSAASSASLPAADRSVPQTGPSVPENVHTAAVSTGASAIPPSTPLQHDQPSTIQPPGNTARHAELLPPTAGASSSIQHGVSSSIGTTAAADNPPARPLDSETLQLSKKMARLCGSHRNNADQVALLLQAGADPNYIDASGWTPIMCCAMNLAQAACWTKVKVLLEHGGDIHSDIVRIQSSGGGRNAADADKGRSVCDFLAERIGTDFVDKLRRLEKGINAKKSGAKSEDEEEHGYLFQDVGAGDDV